VSHARFIVGDALTVLQTMPDNSVDLILTSPPFLALRSYLPADHPDKALELGSEPTPGEYVDALMMVVEELARVLAPHGSLCIELGDTYAGSGGAGGDYNDGGWREGQQPFDGSMKHARVHDPSIGPPIQDKHGKRQGGGVGWPLAKSLTLIPEIVRFTLAYGHNPLTGRTTEPWRIRNVVRWCRPNPPVGALGDKFRPATTDMLVACKGKDRWFDLDAVRTPWSDNTHAGGGGMTKAAPNDEDSQRRARGLSKKGDSNGGAPPLDYWVIPTQPYKGAHYATFPTRLCETPIEVMCPRRVCVDCGKPSRRITRDTSGFDRQPELAAYIAEKREAAGLTTSDLNEHFGYREIAKNWERTDMHGRSFPNLDDYTALKDLLGLDDRFDDLIYGDRTWTESTVDYVTDEGEILTEKRTRYDRGGTGDKTGNNVKAARKAPDDWTDCGHNQWRNGIVLDPFCGSGTTLEVATGHGRDAIGIDLDESNADLALERVGPLLLEVECASA